MTKEESREKKKYLRRLTNAEHKRMNLKERIKEVEEEYQNAKAQNMSGFISGSGTKHDLSDYIVKLEKLNQDYFKWNLKAEEIKDVISMLESGVEEKVLLLRYKDELNWGEIASELHRSVSGIYAIHSMALQNLEIGH